MTSIIIITPLYCSALHYEHNIRELQQPSPSISHSLSRLSAQNSLLIQQKAIGLLTIYSNSQPYLIIIVYTSYNFVKISIIYRLFKLHIPILLIQMFSISDEGTEEAFEPPMSAAGMHRQSLQTTPNQSNQHQPTQNAFNQETNKETNKGEEQLSDCTRFCKLNFYRPFFNVNQNEVKTRITQALTLPPDQQFFIRAKLNPDFYGPFWIITTLILLLGCVDNLSNYLLSVFKRGEKWQGYFFKLQYLRYAITVIYSYSLLIPGGFFLYYKFIVGKTNISFPQIICLYGYALSSYLPAIVVCILPLEMIHWVAMIYAFINSGLFLLANLRGQIEGVQEVVLAGVIGSVQLVLSLILKFYFLGLISTS